MKKKIALVIIVFILLMLMNMVHAETKENPPEDIEQLFDGYCRELLKLYPEYATQLGITEEMGYKIEKATVSPLKELNDSFSKNTFAQIKVFL